MVEAHLRAIADIRTATSDTADVIKCSRCNSTNIRELKALGRPVEFWDDWLAHEVVNKLAFETRKQWELSLISKEPPTFELTTFLEVRCRSLAMLTTPAAQIPMSHSTMPKSTRKSAEVFHAIPEQNHSRCMYCNAAHKIYSCEKFHSLDSTAKSKCIKEAKACLNCLSHGHYKERCNNTSACRICHQRHHTLLHNIAGPTTSTAFSHVIESTRTAPNTTTASSANQLTNTAAACISSCLSSGSSPLPSTQRIVLLSTALVRVRDFAGQWQTARLLFDSGSHASFVTEACVQRSGLPRKSSSVFVTGIGASQGGRCRGETLPSLSSYRWDECYAINALILKKITSDLPTRSLNVPEWPHIHGLFLADPHFMKPGRIDILVGMDAMDQLICIDLRKGPTGTPMAQKTVFGWTLFGSVDSSASTPPAFTATALRCSTGSGAY
ncbi:PREDICTED: uncharacterized protein LOC108365103 [Rhagoletis zephyria]|uniref:uncharacterized protein LOC108365103 n=1 Tax=Rhagoletis zephyria TaxID=28612 RepID=UPI0008116442|nr:PREDICTED: uncharacterized protein LOC108365103 [Rhagoletis zephyria]